MCHAHPLFALHFNRRASPFPFPFPSLLHRASFSLSVCRRLPFLVCLVLASFRFSCSRSSLLIAGSPLTCRFSHPFIPPHPHPNGSIAFFRSEATPFLSTSTALQWHCNALSSHLSNHHHHHPHHHAHTHQRKKSLRGPRGKHTYSPALPLKPLSPPLSPPTPLPLSACAHAAATVGNGRSTKHARCLYVAVRRRKGG